jgi:hypothetical protein
LTRTYRGRFGQPVTDPDVIEARRVVTQMRRLITIGVNAGRPWDQAATLGDVAKACKLSVERTLAILRRYSEAWLLGINDGVGDPATWTVYQDGE